jgi:hypothetical protein
MVRSKSREVRLGELTLVEVEAEEWGRRWNWQVVAVELQWVAQGGDCSSMVPRSMAEVMVFDMVVMGR